jgi:hypothetical protein
MLTPLTLRSDVAPGARDDDDDDGCWGRGVDDGWGAGGGA